MVKTAAAALVCKGEVRRQESDEVRKNSDKDYNDYRMRNFNMQLEEIKKAWDGKYAWVMLTVESGTGDDKKVCLELLPTSESEVELKLRRAYFAEKTAMQDLLRGKTHKSSGDMDEVIRVDSMEGLTAEALVEKSKIIPTWVVPNRARLDGPAPPRSRLSLPSRSSCSSASTTPSPRPYGSRSSIGASPRPNLKEIEDRLAAVLKDLKDAGLSQTEVDQMVRRKWSTIPEPAPRPAPVQTPPEVPLPPFVSKDGKTREPSDLNGWIEYTRESRQLAYIMFNFKF